MTKATFLTIERPLEPQPPKNSKPYWYGAGDKLCFYFLDKKGRYIEDGKGNYKKTKDIDVPEARLSWIKHPDPERKHDVFEHYGHCEVFYDKNHGWQLRWSITHGRAKFWKKRIISYIRRYHNRHYIKSMEEKQNANKQRSRM